MSTFRAFERRSRSELNGNEAIEERLALRDTTFQMSGGLEEHKRRRHATPADKPLPRTLAWLASLPPNVQPTALIRRYPRIANVIAATWGHATSLRSYMDCLYSENRGTHRGFPLEVLRELVALKRYHDILGADSSTDRAANSH